MNRFTQKVLSGSIAAGLMVAVVATANGQQARSGAWTLNAPAGEVHMTGIDYGLQRFSPLKQITTSNVAELRPVWSFSTGTLRGHEGNPLIVKNVMYVHTSFPNIVYALDRGDDLALLGARESRAPTSTGSSPRGGAAGAGKPALNVAVVGWKE